MELRELSWARSSRGLLQNPQRVGEPVEPSRPQDLLIRKSHQARAQRQQMARKVSAVHGRDVKSW